MAMAMEALDACGKHVGQLLAEHTETRTRGTGIVELRLYLAVLGVDTKPVRHRMLAETLANGAQAFVLREGVEGDVTAQVQYLAELVLLVGGAVGMAERAELFERKACLAQTAGRGVTDVLAEDGEGAPQGKSLEGKDNLHVGFVGHALDELQVPPEQLLLKQIVRTHQYTSFTLSTQSVLSMVPVNGSP